MDVPGDLAATLHAVQTVVDDTLSLALTGEVAGIASPGG